MCLTTDRYLHQKSFGRRKITSNETRSDYSVGRKLIWKYWLLYAVIIETKTSSYWRYLRQCLQRKLPLSQPLGKTMMNFSSNDYKSVLAIFVKSWSVLGRVIISNQLFVLSISDLWRRLWSNFICHNVIISSKLLVNINPEMLLYVADINNFSQ